MSVFLVKYVNSIKPITNNTSIIPKVMEEALKNCLPIPLSQAKTFVCSFGIVEFISMLTTFVVRGTLNNTS